MKRKSTGIVLILSGLLLIAAASFLWFHNQQEAIEAAEASEAVLEQLYVSIVKKTAEHGARQSDGLPGEETSAEKNRLVIEPVIPEMPTEEVDGNAYIGVLEIPDVELTLPVMADWDYEKLNVSPCRYVGSYYSGDLVICAHNYLLHFYPLLSIAIGTDVYFTNVEGAVFHYVVANRETVQPTDVEKMVNAAQGWDLTLFTCNLGGQTRCAVRCIAAE